MSKVQKFEIVSKRLANHKRLHKNEHTERGGKKVATEKNRDRWREGEGNIRCKRESKLRRDGRMDGWMDGWRDGGGREGVIEAQREKERGMRMKCEFGSVRAAV